MATTNLAPPTFSATLGAADTLVLPAAASGVVGRWIVHVVSSSFSGSITVKGRLAGSGNTLVAIPYVGRYLNGAVGSDASGTAAITDTSLVDIDATGLEVALVCTSYTSGSMDVKAIRVEG